MARGTVIDGPSVGRSALLAFETLARASDFNARWQALGGEALDVAVADFLDADLCEALSLPQMPAWAEAAGALLSRKGSRALVWAMPAQNADGVVQIAFRTPQSWACHSVRIRYYVIIGGADARGSSLSVGVEQASGSLVVLTPPARGETLALISKYP